ncbi:MAG: hypothetical protein IKK37_07680 [Clostridia bacterium]|nr:hypothetical protein [Clostridia bacterium]
MNKKLKKFMSVILCAVMLFTMPSVAFAAEDNAEVLEKNYACHYYNSMDFIVVTFDSKYSEIGEKPEVKLYIGSYAFAVTEDEIVLEIFEYEGERYPQLLINTEIDIYDITDIKIGEGAFVTESGEISGKVKIPHNKIDKTYDFGVSCEIEAFEVEENVGLISGKMCQYTTVGKPVEIVGNGEYGKIWIDEITAAYTVNGKTVEINSNEFVPQEPGRYVVELKLGDVVVRTLEFEVLSEIDSYFKSLGDSTEWLLLTPLYLVIGAGLLLIPGFGTWIGSTTLMASFAMIPRFFKALFGGPAYEDYVLE